MKTLIFIIGLFAILCFSLTTAETIIPQTTVLDQVIFENSLSENKTSAVSFMGLKAGVAKDDSECRVICKQND
jgi:hypothetical protein